MHDYKKLILVSVVLSILMLTGFFAVQQHYRNRIYETRIEQYSNQQEIIAQQIGTDIAEFIDTFKIQLLAFTVSSTDPVTSNRVLSQSILAVARVDRTGSITNLYGDPSDHITTENVLAQEFYYSPQFTNTAHVEERYNVIDNRSLLLISIPVYNQDSFDGIVVGIIDVQTISDIYLDQLILGSDTYAWAMKEDGTVIKQPRHTSGQSDNIITWTDEFYPENLPAIFSMTVQQKGTVVTAWNDTQIITSYAHTPVGSEDWIIALSTDYDIVVQGIGELEQEMFSILVSIALLASSFFVGVLVFMNRFQGKLEAGLYGVPPGYSLEPLKQKLSAYRIIEMPSLDLDRINTFINRHPNALIMLTETIDDPSVLEELSSKSVPVIAPIDLKTLESTSVHIKELGDALRPQLEGVLHDILSFIMQRNTENRKTVFKDVSREFDITKPTTKKKLKELERLSLISIHKHGRSKTLHVTQKGRETL